MRMRTLLMLITSVWIKIQLNTIRTFRGQYLKGNYVAPKENAGYAQAQISNASPISNLS